MSSRNQKWWVFLLALFIVGSGVSSKAYADPEFKLAKYLQEVRMGGDYRLRFDSEHYQRGATADRSRFRMRLRLNMDFIFPDNFAVKTTFASGTGEATSTNQTFTGLNSQKALWIDRAYVEWGPWDWLKLQGGRMANPLWTIYASDVVWDADVNPEGFSQGFNRLVGSNFNVFFNAMQMIAVERSGDVHDGSLFVEQVGTEVRLPLESRLKVAGAYYDWKNINQSNFGQLKAQEGNRRNNTGSVTAAGNNNQVLTSTYGVVEFTAELSGWLFRKPLSIQGTFIKNNRIHGSGSLYAEKENVGYQVGTIFGKAKEARTWELAYFYKYVQGDATVADIADSDFGPGGINRYGHIMWAGYSPSEWLNFRVKYLMTKNIEKTISFGQTGDVNRIQVDTQVKF